jgi:hypothetical protein
LLKERLRKLAHKTWVETCRKISKVRIDHTSIGRVLSWSAKLSTCCCIQQWGAKSSDGVCISAIHLINLKFRNELFHGSLLLVHVIFENLDLGLEANIFFTVSVDLDL